MLRWNIILTVGWLGFAEVFSFHYNIEHVTYTIKGGDIVPLTTINLDDVPSDGLVAFSITPPLPEGLEIVQESGEIQGRPQQLSDETEYTIVQSDDGVETQAAITITVTDDFCSDGKAFTASSDSFTDGTNEYQFYGPSASCVFVIHPSPENFDENDLNVLELRFNRFATEEGHDILQVMDFEEGSVLMASGAVVPQTIVSTNYSSPALTIIWETDEVVEDLGWSISYAVRRAVPGNLRYEFEAITLRIGSSINNVPSHTGGHLTSYTIEPRDVFDKTGLSISSSTGVISGSPTTKLDATKFTVTGSNEAGSVQVQMEITILENVALCGLQQDGATFNLDVLQLPRGEKYKTTANFDDGETSIEYTFNVCDIVDVSEECLLPEFEIFDDLFEPALAFLFVAHQDNILRNTCRRLGTAFDGQQNQWTLIDSEEPSRGVQLEYLAGHTTRPCDDGTFPSLAINFLCGSTNIQTLSVEEFSECGRNVVAFTSINACPQECLIGEENLELCGGHGSCGTEDGVVKCICNQGFTGPDCSETESVDFSCEFTGNGASFDLSSLMTTQNGDSLYRFVDANNVEFDFTICGTALNAAETNFDACFEDDPSLAFSFTDSPFTRCTRLSGSDPNSDAKLSLIDQLDPTKGVQLSYLHGDSCYNDQQKSFNIILECEDSIELQFVSAANPNVTQDCLYQVATQTIAACPTQCVNTETSRLCSGHGSCDYNGESISVMCNCDNGFDGSTCEVEVPQEVPEESGEEVEIGAFPKLVNPFGWESGCHGNELSIEGYTQTTFEIIVEQYHDPNVQVDFKKEKCDDNSIWLQHEIGGIYVLTEESKETDGIEGGSGVWKFTRQILSYQLVPLGPLNDTFDDLISHCTNIRKNKDDGTYEITDVTNCDDTFIGKLPVKETCPDGVLGLVQTKRVAGRLHLYHTDLSLDACVTQPTTLDVSNSFVSAIASDNGEENGDGVEDVKPSGGGGGIGAGTITAIVLIVLFLLGILYGCYRHHGKRSSSEAFRSLNPDGGTYSSSLSGGGGYQPPRQGPVSLELGNR